MSVLTVFLIDDHEVVRQGLQALLEAQPDLQVVGEAGTAAEAMDAVPALRPDVAVIDVRLPDGDGITVCRELRSLLPEMACLMLTSYGDEQALEASVLAGASGYVLTQVRGTDLIHAIRTVAGGGTLLDPTTTSTLISRMRTMSRADPRDVLSPQERRILGHIGEGMTNRQIGEQLNLAEKTVKNNVSTMLGKLGLVRRTQAAVLEAELRTGGTYGGSRPSR
jgi:DNA-binding NarL/FixJ family response regulator